MVGNGQQITTVIEQGQQRAMNVINVPVMYWHQQQWNRVVGQTT